MEILHGAINKGSLSFLPFPVLSSSTRKAVAQKLSRFPSHRFRVDFFEILFLSQKISTNFEVLSHHRVPVFVEIWCRRCWWCRWFVFCRVMYLPHMSKNTFSCQVITKSHPYNQTLQQMSSKYFASTETISSINNRSWFQIRFSRCYWVSAMLYLLVRFELRIGFWSKTFPLLNFLWQPLDGSTIASS